MPETESLALTLPIRRLVEFLLRSGSIDSRFTGFDRANEGARLHRKLQRAAVKEYPDTAALLAQQIVRAAPDNDAALPLGELSDGLRLRQMQLIRKRELPCDIRVSVNYEVPHRERIEKTVCRALIHLFKNLGVVSPLLRRKGDELLVVIGDAELLRHQLRNLPAAASKLSAHCDNFFHSIISTL